MEHWTNKIKTFKDLTLEELEETLNEFSKENFVYATNIFPYEYKEGNVNEPETIRVFDLIIFYKTPPEQE